jgi:hypothetical protein
VTISEPRDLTSRERTLLSFLLAARAFPGAQELAAQVEGTRVVGGRATLLDLATPKNAPSSARQDGPIPIRAFVQSPDGESLGEILVWVKDGCLAGLEFAWYTDDTPTEMPEPDRIRFE